MHVPNLRFCISKACHRASFMAQGIYCLKYTLLEEQVGFLSTEQMSAVTRMRMFVGLFHGYWFLRCAIASQAPLQDIQAIQAMKQYAEFDSEVAEQVLASFGRHPWYLCQELVVFSLLDKNVPEQERKAVAEALLEAKEEVSVDTFQPGKPEFPPVTGNQFWPEGSDPADRPGLHQFVGPKSWLIFERLGLRDIEGAMDWLKLSVGDWELMTGFKKYKAFVENLTVVNDPAERGIKLIQDFVESSTDEKTRQDLLLAVSEDRKQFPGTISKKELKQRKL